MTWHPSQDFPENSFCDERYEELVALEWRIRLHADDPRTLVDMDDEIRRHIREHRELLNRGVRHSLITEWQEHFCTLWEMRDWLKRERKNAATNNYFLGCTAG